MKMVVFVASDGTKVRVRYNYIDHIWVVETKPKWHPFWHYFTMHKTPDDAWANAKLLIEKING